MSMRSELKTIIETQEAAEAAVTAAVVVERARDAAAYPDLNRHLWQVPDADLAAEARLARAHRLLITLHVTVAETGETTRMLVHTTGVPGYQSMDSISRIPDLAAAKIKSLLEDIGRARARLRAFRAALPENVAIDVDEALEAAENRANAAIQPAEQLMS